MENASNQDDEKAVDNVVSNHGKAVDNVIDTQILNAFMEVDLVFNLVESKNDTTIAAVDVLMNNETIVDDVQIEYASNHDDGKTVDNVVSNHGKVVDNVVSNLLQPEIDTQILNAFMKVDLVFNPAGMDVDVEGQNGFQACELMRPADTNIASKIRLCANLFVAYVISFLMFPDFI
nr:hypothetical protein [Tanacetum cinerariifolium]